MGTGIRLSTTGAVARIELDGADRLNPIGTSTYTALAAAVERLQQDGTTRAVVLSGVGRGFCAGADIEELSGLDASGFGAYVHGFTDALDVLAASPLPIVAAVHGMALGGGLEVAMACHLRVVSATAKLGLPEVKLGVLPGAGGTQRLPRLVPPAVALEMLLLGDPITGQRAFDLGLATVVSDDPVAAALELAGRLAGGAPLAQAAAIDLLRRTAALPVADGIPLEREVAVDLFGSPDGAEGFRAFVERRPPVFHGRR